MTKLLPLLTWRGAICDSELTSTTRLVAWALSLYMNERGGSAYPGAARLAHDTGLSESTVRDHLGRLVAEGWLLLVEKGGTRGERRHANVYQAVVPLGITTPPGNVPVPETTATPPGNSADPSGSRSPSLQELSKNSRESAVDTFLGYDLPEPVPPPDLAALKATVRAGKRLHVPQEKIRADLE